MFKFAARQSRPGMWGDVIDHILEGATMPDSGLHGDKHWRAVALAGLRICDLYDQCDRDVVFAFALIHDSQRLNDDYDPEHGYRSSIKAGSCRPLKKLLQREQISLLSEACALHDKGMTSMNMTIGACWDADRSNLWRVGLKPDIRFFSALKDQGDFDKVVNAMENDLYDPPGWDDLITMVG